MRNLIAITLIGAFLSTANTKALAQANEVRPANYRCTYNVEEDVLVSIDIHLVSPGTSYIVYRSEELTKPVIAMVSDMYVQSRTLTLEGDMPYPTWPEGSTFKINLNLESTYSYSKIWFKPHGHRAGMIMACVKL